MAQSDLSPYTHLPIQSPRSDELLNMPTERRHSASLERGLSSPTGMESRWETDPDPLPGWTDQEQQILVAELRRCPGVQKDPQHPHGLLERARRQLPTKTLEEIESCLEHMRSRKVACCGSKVIRA